MNADSYVWDGSGEPDSFDRLLEVQLGPLRKVPADDSYLWDRTGEPDALDRLLEAQLGSLRVVPADDSYLWDRSGTADDLDRLLETSLAPLHEAPLLAGDHAYLWDASGVADEFDQLLEKNLDPLRGQPRDTFARANEKRSTPLHALPDTTVSGQAISEVSRPTLVENCEPEPPDEERDESSVTITEVNYQRSRSPVSEASTADSVVLDLETRRKKIQSTLPAWRTQVSRLLAVAAAVAGFVWVADGVEQASISNPDWAGVRVGQTNDIESTRYDATEAAEQADEQNLAIVEDELVLDEADFEGYGRPQRPSSRPRRSAVEEPNPTEPEPQDELAEEPKEPDVDCLLDPTLPRCVGKRETLGGSGSVTSGSRLPEKLYGREIYDGIKAIKHRTKQCGQTFGAPPGATVQIRFSIEGATGRAVRVKQIGRQTALGDCVTQVVETAQFEQFQAPLQGVAFTFRM